MHQPGQRPADPHLAADRAGRTAAECKALIEHREPRAEDMPFTHADLTKARRLLSYEPRVPIEQGVAEYVAWLRSEADL
jgi:nucleoside-diphosphate-sugar epimerase